MSPLKQLLGGNPSIAYIPFSQVDVYELNAEPGQLISSFHKSLDETHDETLPYVMDSDALNGQSIRSVQLEEDGHESRRGAIRHLMQLHHHASSSKSSVISTLCACPTGKGIKGPKGRLHVQCSQVSTWSKKYRSALGYLTQMNDESGKEAL